MNLKEIQDYVKDSLSKEIAKGWIDANSKVIDDIIRLSVDKTQKWISEKDKPAPVGEHLIVSVNGENLAGILCYKNPDGVWFDVFGNKLNEQSFVQYYRHPVIDTDTEQ